jgi:glycosyltransferase involved in cell wall biosynthesis
VSSTNSSFIEAESSSSEPKTLNEVHRPRVLAIIPSLIPSAVIYTIKPLSVLASRGLVDFDYVLEAKVELSKIRQSDLILYVRNNNEKFNNTLEEAQALHIPTVYDIDDNFWEIPADTPSGNYHRAPERMRQVEHYLRSVSLVRVYNPFIEKRVRQFNSRVFRATAGIDVNLVSAAASSAKNTKIKIAYVTERGSKDELYKLIIPDLKRLLEDFPEQFQVFLWKEAPAELSGHPAIQVVPVEPNYEQFLRCLASTGYDIGLAPLLPTTFYQSKTNTKFRDYGACRIAGIYSDVGVYRDCVANGVTGVLVGHTPGEWYAAIARLAQDEGLRRSVQESAYQYVVDHYRQEIMESEWLALLEKFTGNGSLNALKHPQKVLQAEVKEICVQWGGSDLPAKGFQVFDKSQMAKNKDGIDLSLPFQFVDDSIDIFMIIDQLETVDDLDAVLTEIYRVCRHGAQVCILGRYVHNQVYQANPTIRQALNEHSPRYWTPAEKGWIYPRIYADQDGGPWGLKSAETGPYDLRCIQMDFFYHKEYQSLSAEEKRNARHKFLNVCDRIFYRLLVIKQVVSEDDMNALIEKNTPTDPAQVILRRYEDRVEELEELVGQQAEKLREKETILTWMQTQSKDTAAEQVPTAVLSENPADNYYQFKARMLVSQITSLRKNRLFKLYKRFFDRLDAWNSMPATFDKLKRDSLVMLGSQKGFRLGLSHDLMDNLMPEYPLELPQSGLCEVQLAAAFDLPLTSGEFGIELIGPSGEIVLNRTLPASEVSEQVPVVFHFPALDQNGNRKFILRVFARRIDTPLRLFELQRYSLAGLGRREVRCFAGFEFTPESA